MTDFELHVTSYAGIVPGASHLRGQVRGPYPESCHGGTTFSGRTGKATCAEGHELPPRAEWQVEAALTEARYKHWAAMEFEGDGPEQFKDEEALLATARARFLGEAPAQWWDEKVIPGQPGDRLYYECTPDHALPPEELRDIDRMADAERRRQGLPVHGDLIAEVPQPEDGPRFYVTLLAGSAPRPVRLLGPYRTRAEAEAMTGEAWRLAHEASPGSRPGGVGVTLFERPVKSGGWAPGILNDRLEAAAAGTEE